MRFAKNVDEDSKNALTDLSHLFGTQLNLNDRPKEFGDSIGERLLVTQASVQSKSEEPTKKEGRLVCEIVVTHDMLNYLGNVHGGCSAFLIDICSSMCLMVHQRGTHVSQSLDIVYHSPAMLGETLRIISNTMTMGARVMSARTEIWNATKHRLVASGVHVKMQPSRPKL
ncbi:Acyl-coenzyme A thioesterase 13 [Mycena sanguinolenta]|uniref:Acyl-coenzyme A thioesterase 13 n=1 Tax=Mycena sanguinolenta TaxID=230812 RepID=A0A8H6Z6T9_9AGAR|nr:Acyl-coenzyme A thioesterase 13 [Mycena sanguinolenta]